MSSCRTEEGISIGLIDTVINSSRILSTKYKEQLLYPSKEVREALQDLSEDEDIKWLLSLIHD